MILKKTLCFSCNYIANGYKRKCPICKVYNVGYILISLNKNEYHKLSCLINTLEGTGRTLYLLSYALDLFHSKYKIFFVNRSITDLEVLKNRLLKGEKLA